MAGFLKPRWVLFLVLIVFIACKVPHLFYPYYWDESWPYALAIHKMYLHGISLMPTAVDPELSRGHPLFFHAIAAIWRHIFGASHLAMHSFALFISVWFLIAIYEAGLSLFNQRVALLALLLVSTLMVFFIQSSFVLFEVLIAFLCFLSLVFYVKDKFFLTALCLTAVFYTKESGLIIGFVLGWDALTCLFNKNIDWKTRVFRIVSVAVPCILIGIFFLLQKHIRGWYIFPLYNSLIELNWDHLWYNFRKNNLGNTFDYVSKQYYFLLLLLVSLLAAIKNKNVKYLAPFLPGVMIYILVDDRRGGEINNSYFLLPLFIGSIIAMFYLLRSLKIYADKKQEKMLGLSVVFIVLFMFYSSMNFFTYRYLLAMLIPLFFITAVILDKFIDRTYTGLYYPVLLLVLVISYISFKSNHDCGDSDPGAFQGMDVQQKEVDFMEQNNFYSRSIAWGSFLTYEHLVEPATGFLQGSKHFNNLQWEINGATELILFDNIEPDYRYDIIKKDTGFYRLYRYDKGRLWAEIYARKGATGIDTQYRSR